MRKPKPTFRFFSELVSNATTKPLKFRGENCGFASSANSYLMQRRHAIRLPSAFPFRFFSELVSNATSTPCRPQRRNLRFASSANSYLMQLHAKCGLVQIIRGFASSANSYLMQRSAECEAASRSTFRFFSELVSNATVKSVRLFSSAWLSQIRRA